MDKKNLCFILLSLIILVCVLGLVSAATLTVDDDGSADYSSIQDAINSASSGDTIEVEEGEYAGAIVNKSVEIIGAGEETIITSGVPYKTGNNRLRSAFRPEVDEIEIKNFVIESDVSENFTLGVYAVEVDDVTVDSLTIDSEGTVQGITNWGGSYWIITNNIIESTITSNGGGIGIFVGAKAQQQCVGNLIQYNEISATATAEGYSTPGIFVGLDTRYGDYDNLDGSEDISGNQVLDNTVTAFGVNNSVGIEVGTVLGDSESDPDRTNSTKIEALMESAAVQDNLIEGNKIDGAETGIYFYIVTDLTITLNEIEDSVENGVYTESAHSGVVIQFNNLIDNAYQVLDDTETSLNAKYNWWGTEDGDEIATMVSDEVDYDPWLYKPIEDLDLPDEEGPIFGETTIEPEYPNCEDTLITINSEITDKNGVAFAELFWRYDGGDDNHKAPQFEDGLWITQIYIGQLEDGMEITYHTKATDNAGNEEWSSGSFEPLFTYDCSPPETTLIIGDPSYNNYITSDTEIILTCTDAISGCDKTYYKIDDDDWEEYTEPISAPEGTPDGSYTIYYYSTDNAGNQEDENSQEIILDNTLPEVTLEELDEFYNSIPIDLVFTYSDSGAGISEYKVYKKRLGVNPDFIEVTSISCTGIGTTTCQFMNGTKDGKFEFKVEVIDNVENSQDSNVVDTTLDRAGPDAVILEFPLEGEYVNYQPQLSWFEAEDNDDNLNPPYGEYGVSGVKEYELIVDDGTPVILSELNYQTSGLGEESHNWKVRAWDNAGNNGTWSEVRTFTIDITVPEISNVDVEPYYEGSIYVAGIRTASATVTDDNGVDSVTFSLGDAYCEAEQEEDTWSCNLDTTTLLEDGEYNLIVTAVDVAENEASDDSLVVIVDNTAPTSTIISPDESSIFASNFEVSVSDSDDGSGLNYCEYKVNEGSWTSRECNDEITITVGEGEDCDIEGEDVCEVEVKATDNLENENEAVSRKFSIDLTPPTIEITNIQDGDNIACFQSVTAEITDEISGVGFVYATILNSTGVIANQTMVYDSSRGVWDTTFAGLCSKEVGDYIIKVVGYDIAGNSGSDEKEVYFPSVVAIFSEPPTCNVDSDTGGTCTMEFSFWIRGGNAVMMSMSDINVAAGSLSPTEVNATIFNNQGSAAVGNVDASGPVWNGGVLEVNTPVGYFNLDLTLPANFTASTSVDYYIKPVIV